MPGIKFTFPNASGLNLSALLEAPEADQPIKAYALFAHCFTCGKDIAAASRISRALTREGIAVLRFDFTGLGNSDGDFANTNFSSNVDDLLSAAAALEKDYQAPLLLIGHSLGGAAVLSAADRLPSVKAIATIGSPSNAGHVEHLFAGETETIETSGEALVQIGLRQFTIRKQMLDDLREHASAPSIGNLHKALLIFHSPVDSIVPVDEAAKLYQAARHPKSFISLDDADHLLSRKEDAEYVARTLSAWASRYLAVDKVKTERSTGTAPAVPAGEVVVTELDKKFLRGLYSESHQLMSDEPVSYGGSNLGPSPYELLSMALGSCTSMTLRMYANMKKLEVDDISVRLKHEKIHAEDCPRAEQGNGKIDRITRYIHIEGKLDDAQRARMLEIADRCPVHQSLEKKILIETRPE